ncbi:AAA family ATPase [Pseudidiomarina sp.]|uniref:AAA family ATPase n=1 Tax=Pseudidiomarina sp. TaxID=2081707 RepID=UPI003A96D771
MKPLYLAMTAFGPFATTETVNFDDLGEHPLFLINGPTGAGKTTLLDAINFALYGSSTGDRSGASMRCHHASDTVETEVTFIFSLGDAVYRVDRKPSQTTTAKRGDGLASRKTTAQLYKIVTQTGAPDAWDTELLENSVTDVTKRVNDLIGLNDAQFRQVVVLPQGRFRELLTAKSDERESILASLFNTAEFRRIEDAARERAQQVNSQYLVLKNQLKAQLENAGFQSIELAQEKLKADEAPIAQTAQELTVLKAELEQMQKTLTQAEELSKRFDSLAANEEKLGALNEQADVIAAAEKQLSEHDAAKRIQPEWLDFRQSAEALRTREQALKQAQQQLEQATQTQQHAVIALAKHKQTPAQIDKLKIDLTRFTKQLDDLKTVSAAQQQLKLKTQERVAAHEKKAALAVALEQNNDAFTATKEELNTLNEAVQQHQNTEAKREQLQSHLKQLQQRDTLQKRIKSEEAALLAAKEPITTAEQALNDAKVASQGLRLRWHQEQAIALAHELNPGEPCPVCGSTEHPAPAHATSDTELVTQEQLDAAEAKVAKVSAELDKLRLKVNAAETTLESSQRQLKAQVKELGNLAERSGETAQLNLNDLATLEKRQAQQKQALSEMTTRAEQLAEKAQKHRDQATELSSQLHNVESDIKALESRLDTLDPDKKLRELSAETIESQRSEAQQQIEQLQTQHQLAAEQKATADNQVAAAKKAHETSISEEKTARTRLQTAEKLWITKLTESKFIDTEAFTKALLENDVETQLKQQVKDHQAQLIQVKTLIAQDKQAIGDQVKPDLSALQAKVGELKQNEANIEQTLQSMRTKQEQLRSMIVDYEKRVAESAQLERKYRVIGMLSRTLNGDNELRMSLHRFVLAILLDDVLHEASARLEQMTNNRYRLVRRETVGDRRQQGGLELMVDDTYTGQEREVNTLSGGESFMAALALALGLSDVVQNYSGGIRIDTLFIDEGFGSLDSEALDLAINVLANLRASGRTIGIISHVSELKLRISKRIDVVRGVGGSSLRVGNIG